MAENQWQPQPRPHGHNDPVPADRPGPSLGVLQHLQRWVSPQAWGGWLASHLWAKPGPKDGPPDPAVLDLTEERVASGPAGIAFPWIAPYIDEVTAEPAAARLAYRRMWANPEVKAATLGAILSSAALDLKVMPAKSRDAGAQEVAHFVEWNLQRRLAGGVPGLMWSVLSGGLPDGYSICEKAWQPQAKGRWAGKWALARVKPKDAGTDAILETDQYRNVIGVRGLRYNPGVIWHPSRFLIWRYLPLYDSPVGMSAFRAAYSAWWMLDTGQKLRAVGIEKRVIPFIYGTYKSGSQRASLEAMLANVKSQNWASVPEGVQLDVLSIAGDSAAAFSDFCKDQAHRVFLAIAGATLQGLEGTIPNARGSAKVQEGTADRFVWWLAASVEQLLNDHDCGLVRDMVDLNYAVSDYPQCKLGAVDLEELAKELEIDKGLASIHLALSKQELYERYGRTPPDDPSDSLEPPKQEGPGGPGGGLEGMLGGGPDAPGGPTDPPQPAPDAPAADPDPWNDESPAGPDVSGGLSAFGETHPEAHFAGFAESDWTQGQGPRGGTFWTHNGTGRKVYGKANPGAGKGAKKDAPATEKKAKPEGKPPAAPGEAARAKPVRGGKGSPEAVRAALEGIRAKGGAVGEADISALADAFAALTVPQADALAREMGATPKGKLKLQRAKSIADSLLAGLRGEAKEPKAEAPKEEPKPAGAAPAPVHDDPAVQSAFGDAYRRLAARGVVEIPDLVDEMRKAVPDATPEAIHAALQQWQKEDKLTLQATNDRHLAGRASEGIESPRGLLYHVQARDEDASAFPGSKAAKPDEARGSFIDKQGRQWIDGELVAAKEEPKAAPAAPEDGIDLAGLPDITGTDEDPDVPAKAQPEAKAAPAAAMHPALEAAGVADPAKLNRSFVRLHLQHADEGDRAELARAISEARPDLDEAVGEAMEELDTEGKARASEAMLASRALSPEDLAGSPLGNTKQEIEAALLREKDHGRRMEQYKAMGRQIAARDVASVSPEQRHAILSAVLAEAGKSAWTRPSIPDLYKQAKAAHPGLTVPDFQTVLAQAHIAGHIRLGAFGLATDHLGDKAHRDGTSDNSRTRGTLAYALPMDAELKYYVGTGDKPLPPAPEAVPEAKAAAPAPKPKAAPGAGGGSMDDLADALEREDGYQIPDLYDSLPEAARPRLSEALFKLWDEGAVQLSRDFDGSHFDAATRAKLPVDPDGGHVFTSVVVTDPGKAREVLAAMASEGPKADAGPADGKAAPAAAPAPAAPASVRDMLRRGSADGGEGGGNGLIDRSAAAKLESVLYPQPGAKASPADILEQSHKLGRRNYPDDASHAAVNEAYREAGARIPDGEWERLAGAGQVANYEAPPGAVRGGAYPPFLDAAAPGYAALLREKLGARPAGQAAPAAGAKAKAAPKPKATVAGAEAAAEPPDDHAGWARSLSDATLVDRDFSPEKVVGEVARLKKSPAAAIREAAAALGIVRKLPKAAMLEAIAGAIIGRRGSRDRAGA